MDTKLYNFVMGFRFLVKKIICKTSRFLWEIETQVNLLADNFVSEKSNYVVIYSLLIG